MRKVTNRRQFQRYYAPDATIAVVSDDYQRLGTVKDLSREGLFFEYVSLENFEKPLKAGSKKTISIFRSESNFIIDGLLCEILRDTCEFSKDFPTSSLPVNRCAVKFNGLSTTETEQIGSFLGHCKNE